jgi:hypothetical protein
MTGFQSAGRLTASGLTGALAWDWLRGPPRPGCAITWLAASKNAAALSAMVTIIFVAVD